jgi:hypothetical protein
MIIMVPGVDGIHGYTVLFNYIITTTIGNSNLLLLLRRTEYT